MSSGGMHPHPEALYYHITLDALESAKAENDEFRKKQPIVTALVVSQKWGQVLKYKFF